ncbi:MAG: PQQ-dependent sugar dehydrogenase, partial [Nitrosopumilus sp.]|nr:PQQ-dependent sugar dehydrogenase [Nitrosopumilus sp.]
MDHDGDILFTERNGNLRIIQDGQLLEKSLLTLGVEGGMLGLTVDPNFEENSFIYIYYTYNEFLTTTNKLVRFQLTGNALTEDKTLLDGIPDGP